MTRLTRLLLCGVALAGLSACGLQGDLTRPDPLFGNPDEVPEAERPDRVVTDGLSDLRESTSEDEDGEDMPDADDELLGGPGT